MNNWLVTIQAWPHSTGNGQDADQAAAGEREKNYKIAADDARDAMRFAEAIATGVESNPAVWKAVIVGLSKVTA